MKKSIVTILLIFAMALTVFTGCQLSNGADGVSSDSTVYSDAASVFTVDINPGVRFYLTAEETVITAEGTNADGDSVVAEVEVEGMSVDEAIEAILDEAIEQGFADESEPSVLITVEKEEGAEDVSYASMIQATSVEMKDLKVVDVYTTDDEASSSYGAMTLTCEANGQTVTIRTVVLYDENGERITEDAFLGKTIDVKGIVDYFGGDYQIKVFSAKNITIH